MKAIRLLVAGLIGAATFTVAAPAGPACAAAPRHAVLVVDQEDSGGQYRYCVELPDEDVSGIDLIVLAHDQYGLTYRFGYGGNAVCMLAEVGTEGDDCFADYPYFWGYWHGDDSGGWTWANEGAAATTIQDGDVEGWSWGTGSDGSSHPQPPETAFGSVCEVTAPPPAGGGGDHHDGGAAHREPHASRGHHPHRAEHSSHSGPGPEPSPAPTSGRPRHNKNRTRRRVGHGPEVPPTPGPTSEPRPTPTDLASPEQRPVSATDNDGGSPPIGGIVALAAAAGFGVAAILFRRRRMQ
jgi:hypothetical protein